MNLLERIARGKRAIARAKAVGSDVSAWEAHLKKLKAMACREQAQAGMRFKEGSQVCRGTEDDPVLTPDQWYPAFRDLHRKLAAEISDFDYLWLREHRLDLYQAIKAKENEIDAIGSAPLSRIMETIIEWRRLLLEAYFQQKEHERERAKHSTGQI